MFALSLFILLCRFIIQIVVNKQESKKGKSSQISNHDTVNWWLMEYDWSGEFNANHSPQTRISCSREIVWEKWKKETAQIESNPNY